VSVARTPSVFCPGSQRRTEQAPGADTNSTVCAPANPVLAARLQHLYETAYTRVNGEYFPCHPEVCGPLTEEEKGCVDSRYAVCKAGDQPCPHPIFF